jgi:sugar/nucleoside kinase (ribokinase family)
MKRIVVVGELNVDIIVVGTSELPILGRELIASDITVCPGSSSANCASGLARIGNDVLFIGKVGDDDFGRLMIRSLKTRGVDTSAVIVDPSIRTGITISVAVGDDRAMVTYLGSIESLRFDEVNPSLFDGRTHLHLSSYFLQRGLSPDYPKLFALAKERGLTTSLDLGWDSFNTWNGKLWDVLPYIDLFIPNETEIAMITDEKDVERALKKVASKARLAVVKLGPHGAMALANGRIVRRPPFKVNVVDTTGAGDAFNAGFIHAYLQGLSIEDALDLGNACGAICVQHSGGFAGQPTFEEAQRFIEEQRERPKRSSPG